MNLDFGDFLPHDDKTKRAQQFAMRRKDKSRRTVNEHPEAPCRDAGPNQ